MEIVVNIPKQAYDLLQNEGVDWLGAEHILDAVAKGTPLPEHHGRLKDEDKIIKAIEDRVEFLRRNDATFVRLNKDIDILGCIPKIRCEVPIIIPATEKEPVRTMIDCYKCKNNKADVSCEECHFESATEEEKNCDTCQFDGMCPSNVRLLVAHNGCTTWTPKQTATEEPTRTMRDCYKCKHVLDDKCYSCHFEPAMKEGDGE